MVEKFIVSGSRYLCSELCGALPFPLRKIRLCGIGHRYDGAPYPLRLGRQKRRDRTERTMITMRRAVSIAQICRWSVRNSASKAGLHEPQNTVTLVSAKAGSESAASSRRHTSDRRVPGDSGLVRNTTEDTSGLVGERQVKICH